MPKAVSAQTHSANPALVSLGLTGPCVPQNCFALQADSEDGTEESANEEAPVDAT